MSNYGKGGPNATVCGEEGCGQLLYWDPLDEVWRHELNDSEACIFEGDNDDT